MLNCILTSINSADNFSYVQAEQYDEFMDFLYEVGAKLETISDIAELTPALMEAIYVKWAEQHKCRIDFVELLNLYMDNKLKITRASQASFDGIHIILFH